MKVHEVLKLIGPREVPRVKWDSHIDDVIAALARLPHARLVYVVDQGGRLLGTITLGSLLRHMFPFHYEGKIHPHGILRDITAETAGHLMDKKSVHAVAGEDVDQVLGRMAKSGVKEMAVVDDQGMIIGDMTASDLLRHCFLDKDGEQIPPA